jgi:hypothetical protein
MVILHIYSFPFCYSLLSKYIVKNTGSFFLAVIDAHDAREVKLEETMEKAAIIRALSDV